MYFSQLELGRSAGICVLCGTIWLFGAIMQLTMYRFNLRMLENDRALQAHREEVSLLSRARQVE
tara:strand:+ start:8652 stop:8843 length:192 start_codon:yes stop_codon:yes gene_type:complete